MGGDLRDILQSNKVRYRTRQSHLSIKTHKSNFYIPIQSCICLNISKTYAKGVTMYDIHGNLLVYSSYDDFASVIKNHCVS